MKIIFTIALFLEAQFNLTIPSLPTPSTPAPKLLSAWDSQPPPRHATGDKTEQAGVFRLPRTDTNVPAINFCRSVCGMFPLPYAVYRCCVSGSTTKAAAGFTSSPCNSLSLFIIVRNNERTGWRYCNCREVGADVFECISNNDVSPSVASVRLGARTNNIAVALFALKRPVSPFEIDPCRMPF